MKDKIKKRKRERKIRGKKERKGWKGAVREL